MNALVDASHQTVAALRSMHADSIADRIERCAAARCHRVAGQRPWTCRGPGCPWCCRSLLAHWQTTLFDWLGFDTETSTIVVDLSADHRDLRVVVRAFRRALRDLRDRAGRRWRTWRTLRAAGILVPAVVGRRVVLRVHHKGLTRPEVETLFKCRWPSATISTSPAAPYTSTVSMSDADRMSLALLRRGLEPLRIVLSAQGDRASRLRSRPAPMVAPMPMLF